jgi:hypothetical protein
MSDAGVTFAVGDVLTFRVVARDAATLKNVGVDVASSSDGSSASCSIEKVNNKGQFGNGV